MAKASKGSAFEREISKYLSLWWSEGKRDDIFWRSTQSGGRATQRAKFGKKTAGSYGDISCLSQEGTEFLKYFCLELKRGYTKGVDVLDFIDSKKAVPVLKQFWQQCERDKKLGKRKASMIIFKRDRKEKCIMICEKIFNRLQRKIEQLYEHEKIIVCFNNNENLLIARFEYFFEWLNPRIFK